jgi:anti-sigma factor RsiW
MNDDDIRLTPDEEENFVASVLRRTSGAACQRAEEWLCDYVDGSLGRDDQALVEGHLEHCMGCARLAEALRVSAEVLPALAAFDPGPGFTEAVLAATRATERAGWSAARVIGLAGVGLSRPLEALTASWNRWLARPRFAFEAAYAATLVLVLVVGNPATTLHAASAMTRTAAEAGIVRARQAWPTAVELPSAVREIRAATGAALERRAGSARLDDAWGRALERWSNTWLWARGLASELVRDVTLTYDRVRAAVASWFTHDGTRASEPRAGSAR